MAAARIIRDNIPAIQLIVIVLLRLRREQKTGEDMYAAQYHENFADLAFRAKDDMGGKTITLKSMTVEGIIGADGKGRCGWIAS